MEDPQTSKAVTYSICSVPHLSGARNNILLIPSRSQAALSSTSTDLVQLQNTLKFLTLLISSKLSEDSNFTEMLMSEFWTTYTVPSVT